MNESTDWYWICGNCGADNLEADHPHHCQECGGSRRGGGPSQLDMPRR